MKLYRKASKEMPFLYFYEGQINLKGKSIPFHKCDISDVLKSYMSNYVRNPQPLTEINIDLEYINCQTQRNLVHSMKLMNEMHEKGMNIRVNWFYDRSDDYMFEFGTILQSMTDVRFAYIEKEYAPCG
jgi:hypothetical protein